MLVERILRRTLTDLDRHLRIGATIHLIKSAREVVRIGT